MCVWELGLRVVVTRRRNCPAFLCCLAKPIATADHTPLTSSITRSRSAPSLHAAACGHAGALCAASAPVAPVAGAARAAAGGAACTLQRAGLHAPHRSAVV